MTAFILHRHFDRVEPGPLVSIADFLVLVGQAVHQLDVLPVSLGGFPGKLLLCSAESRRETHRSVDHANQKITPGHDLVLGIRGILRNRRRIEIGAGAEVHHIGHVAASVEEFIGIQVQDLLRQKRAGGIRRENDLDAVDRHTSDNVRHDTDVDVVGGVHELVEDVRQGRRIKTPFGRTVEKVELLPIEFVRQDPFLGSRSRLRRPEISQPADSDLKTAAVGIVDDD